MKLEYSGEQPKKPYIVLITDTNSKQGLERDWDHTYSEVSASILKEGNILEMRTYEGKKEKRVYYIVVDGEFYAFLRRERKYL